VDTLPFRGGLVFVGRTNKEVSLVVALEQALGRSAVEEFLVWPTGDHRFGRVTEIAASLDYCDFFSPRPGRLQMPRRSDAGGARSDNAYVGGNGFVAVRKSILDHWIPRIVADGRSQRPARG